MLFLLACKKPDLLSSFYDCAAGFVIRASSHKRARKIASKNAGTEGAEFWLDSKKSTCRKLSSCEGEKEKEEIILREFYSA